MNLKKKIGFSFLSLAYLVILLHSFIPHHHHPQHSNDHQCVSSNETFHFWHSHSTHEIDHHEHEHICHFAVDVFKGAHSSPDFYLLEDKLAEINPLGIKATVSLPSIYLPKNLYYKHFSSRAPPRA